MSSHSYIRDEFIQELKGIVGLSPDQLFQLLMEREKTAQKTEERKILELEIEYHDKKTKNGAQTSEWDKRFNQIFKNHFIHYKKSLQDLCTDELVSIFGFIPDCDVFKLARVSKQFYEIVMNDIKRVHLFTQVQNPINFFKHFLSAEWFKNVKSLIIDFNISLDIATTIFNNSDNLRELKISILSISNGYITFSNCPVKLETLHITFENDDSRVELDNLYLYNLTDLKIDRVNCDVSEYLNEQVNNIKKLHLRRAKCDLMCVNLKSITHLTLEECTISDTCLHSLLVDTLEHVQISKCKCIPHRSDLDRVLPKPTTFPFLKILILKGLAEI